LSEEGKARVSAGWPREGIHKQRGGKEREGGEEEEEEEREHWYQK
jgi:hypothetical protein